MIVVDLETTGLLKPDTRDPEQQPGIVQIALAKVQYVGPDTGYRATDWKTWLVNPEKPVWDPDAIKTHGINPGDVKDAPTLAALHPELCDWFAGQHTWIGFNNEFDRKVLFYSLARLSMEARFPWPWIDMDVMKIAKPVVNIPGKRDIKFPSLIECHKELVGEDYKNAHDAGADIMATLNCLNALASLGYV
jgi:DNA polymerase III epsilon subunit-like protein